MSCTTILVGKNAAYDGSTIIARTEDSPSGEFTPKYFTVVLPKDQPRHYRSVLSACQVDLPDNPHRYTALPNSDPSEGIWAAAGVNDVDVSMTATETITTNARVLGADPLLPYPTKEEKFGGLGEEDLVSLVLPYISSAREGVLRLGSLLTQYGTYESNGIAFQDGKEIWWLETIGGHHWMARRVPDNSYVVMPNQLGIDAFDFADAKGKGENFLCSPDLQEWTEKNHLALDMDGDFNPRLAYGSHDPSDHTYNTPRAWYIHRYLSPQSYLWDGPEAEYGPEEDDLPWSLVPDRKITIEDIKAVLSSHYEGTPFDCYSRHADPLTKNKYRPIGISRNNVTHITQIRPYQSDFCRSVEWLSFGSNAFNASLAFYSNVLTTPDYVGQAITQADSHNIYWANRIIAALCDAHFQKTANLVERHQKAIAAKAHAILQETDAKIRAEDANPQFLCQQANQEMADFAQKETQSLLDQVLYIASMEMKNGFARSDN